MSSLWTDLLFLHGHIHDPELARRLANTPGGKRPEKGTEVIKPERQSLKTEKRKRGER